MTDTLTIVRPDDWHLHLRDGDALADVVGDTARQFGRAIIMPNLKPPVTTTAQARAYRERILAALPAGTQFEPLMTNAIHRTPCLETAKIKMLLNGPESFTPDGNFILGETPELRNCFVAAGFNSAGIANSGGAGKLIAEWIVGGEAPSDLWDVDIRRFGPFMANRKALAERTGETLGLHYAMRWPRQELETARPLRTSPRPSW